MALGGTQDELLRRHRVAVKTVGGLITLTLALIAVSFVLGRFRAARTVDPVLSVALRITIVIFGLGAVALRRTRFAPLRLQDVAALRGMSGLLATLQNTSVQVAFIGAAIAVMGFVISLLSGDALDMLYVGLAAIAVLLYAYPRRATWQRLVQSIERSGVITPPPAKGRVA